MIRSGILWRRPPSELLKGIDRYEKDLMAEIEDLLRRFAPQIESYAKANAPWTDRTAAARQTLFTVVEAKKDRVILYLSHTMSYGVYLELRWQGRWSIIMRTLQAHESPIMDGLKRLVS